MNNVDDRICIFYVADRIKNLENISAFEEPEKLQQAILEFKDELLKHIGINVMIKRSEEEFDLQWFDEEVEA